MTDEFETHERNDEAIKKGFKMNDPQFTVGNWDFKSCIDEIWSDRKTIAEVYGGSNAEVRDNGYVMAAAKDLFEALDMVSDAIANNEPMEELEHLKEIVIDKALAKARGIK